MIFSAFRRYALPSPALIPIGIALLAVLLGVGAQWLSTPSAPFFADEWLRDRFLRLAVSSAPEPRVLVVDIDEASTAALGPWPWPRARLADLVEQLLTTYAARGVALDIVLPDAADRDGDTRLSLLAQHAPVVLGQAFDYFHPDRPEALQAGQLAGATTLHGAVGVPASGYIANHAGLAQASHVGNIGYIPDPDGILRRLPLMTRYKGRGYPALSLALLDCCSGGKPLQLAGNGVQRPAWRRDWSAYTVVSAADILQQAIVPSSASGRLVLIGSSSLSLGDRVATPLASDRPGLGVQATMLSSLLDQQAGLGPALWPGRWIACLFTAATAYAAWFAFPRLTAAASVTLLGASCAGWLLLAYLVAPHAPALVTTGPLASNLFLLAVAVPYHWQTSQSRSRHLLGTLRQYVAREVVEQLLRADLRDPLAPRLLDVTTLIADMEGYTTQVEALPLDEAAQLTRDFLDCLTGPVIAQQGTLDKYTGDGLVAFWGAPLPQRQHADLALDAARAIVQRVQALSASRLGNGRPPLRVRIGIESGAAMAGDFGSSFRSIYTAVGDSVNTASRLEQVARDFPHDVIIGPGTVQRASRHSFLALGSRLLRGKEKPTELYTLAPLEVAA